MIPYCGSAPDPAGWLAQWNFDPLLLCAMAVTVLLWRRRPRERQSDLAASASLALTLLLFVSPLCALGSALFTARVVHHVLLAAVLAPLLAVALRPHARIRGSLTANVAVQTLVFWAWHAPSPYSAAMSNDALFWLMQLTITASALGFWSAVLRAEAPAAAAGLLATMVQMGVLGALITFAPRALYPPHLETTAAWGLSPLEDQQIAGLFMWAPAAAIYLMAALAILYRSIEGKPAR
jgi:putative membrane protein